MSDKDDNVISMAEKLCDGTRWSVQQMLLDAVKDAVEFAPPKGLVIMLDDSDERYKMHYLQSGMKYSEMVALLEAMKHHLTRCMISG